MVVEVDAERIVGWTIVSAQEGSETVSTITMSPSRHVPVVKDGRLAGIVSIGDVVKNAIEELETERQHLVGYIQTAQT